MILLNCYHTLDHQRVQEMTRRELKLQIPTTAILHPQTIKPQPVPIAIVMICWLSLNSKQHLTLLCDFLIIARAAVTYNNWWIQRRLLSSVIVHQLCVKIGQLTYRSAGLRIKFYGLFFFSKYWTSACLDSMLYIYYIYLFSDGCGYMRYVPLNLCIKMQPLVSSTFKTGHDIDITDLF